jgi:HPt (histidine-containing phosphotransfer) domain-containing protein
MNGHVSKPFQTEELLLKMSSALRVVQSANASSEEASSPTTLPPLPPLPDRVTDMTFLLGFTSGKIEKVQKYVGMFLENGPKLMQQVEDALAAKDYATLKIAAHSLKPQLSYMGVKEEVSGVFLTEQAASEEGHHEKLAKLVRNLKRVTEKAFEELRAQTS